MTEPDLKTGTSPHLLAEATASNMASELPTPVPMSPAFPPTPGPLSRSASFSGNSAYSTFQDQDDMEGLPPLDRLTIFDFLENLALPQRLEKLQNTLSARTEKMRQQQKSARRRVVEEWRKRIPPPADEQISRYQKRMKSSVDRVSKRWTDTRSVTLREKVSFIAGVLNIFISGYLIGAFPEYFHLWYSAQLCYFYPIRFYTYHKRGYHYFLVDLCYFVNVLLLLSIWVFPQSKRLFISTFCLAFGNNAVAIAMWRNALVFHSLDKVTSLFIHIMPCVTLHCLVHLIPKELQERRFRAIYDIIYSQPGAPEHYSLASMIVWSTLPYAMWQLSYHFLITVRRREKIAAGRPTSFTWLRRSYGKTALGRFVLGLPETMQEPAFMLIQYLYALLTMVPAPLWFWSRWASSAFLMAVFTWSVYNGAVYYIDVFGQRMQKELDQLKREVARWQTSPDMAPKTPLTGIEQGDGHAEEGLQYLSLGAAAKGEELPGSGESAASGPEAKHQRANSGGSGLGSEDYFNIPKDARYAADASSTGVERSSTDAKGIRDRA